MIVLLAATPQESALLREHLPFSPDPCLSGRTFSCHFCGEELLLLHTGVGIASAALNLSRLFAGCKPELLLAFGCGGSYPASGLQNGDLAICEEEVFADFGVETEKGFQPLAALGLTAPKGEPELFCQQVRLDARYSTRALKLLRQAPELKNVRVKSGAFATVNRVSGTKTLSGQLQERTAAICENMEGAAFAQVASEFGVPLLEIRGISNPCGTRDRALWDLPTGMEVAQRAMLRLLKDLPELRSAPCS